MAAPAWVAALPSDDDEYDELQPRRYPASGPSKVMETQLYVVEDEDVKVVNVVKYQEPRPYFIPVDRQEDARNYGLWRSLGGPKKFAPFNTRQEIHLPASCETSVDESNESSRKRRRKSEARLQGVDTPNFESQNVINIDGNQYNVYVESQFREQGIFPELQLRREQGILGRGPASQLRRGQGNRGAGESSLELKEPGLVERGSSSAPGSERFHLHMNGRSVEQEQINTIIAPDLKSSGLRGRPQAPGPSLEKMLAGGTMNEWWTSLLASLGRELSVLHWEIINFCKAYELTTEQIMVRRQALAYVERAVHEIWPSAEVHLFGSTATGLALPWSDIDVAVMSAFEHGSWQTPSTSSLLAVLGRELKKHGHCQSVKQIPHAKVPILKVVFTSGLSCDISFGAHNGPRGVPVIRQFMQQYEALRPICLVLKFFLGQQALNELYTGGLGSFCLISMVISHLQQLGLSGAGHDLGALLLSFFTRYGRMHNYRTDVVSTRSDYFASKQARGWVNSRYPELLAVEDPLDPTSDIAKGSFKIQEVRTKFLRAQKALLTHWNQENVLAQLVDTSGNPNHRPKPQVGKGKVVKKKKQKKRKKPSVVGDEENDALAVHVRKRAKSNPKQHLQQGGDLVGRKFKKYKQKQKKLKRREEKEQEVERIVVGFWDSKLGQRINASRKTSKKGKS